MHYFENRISLPWFFVITSALFYIVILMLISTHQRRWWTKGKVLGYGVQGFEITTSRVSLYKIIWSVKYIIKQSFNRKKLKIPLYKTEYTIQRCPGQAKPVKTDIGLLLQRASNHHHHSLSNREHMQLRQYKRIVPSSTQCFPQIWLKLYQNCI